MDIIYSKDGIEFGKSEIYDAGKEKIYIELDYFKLDTHRHNISLHQLSKPLGYTCIKGMGLKQDKLFEDFLDSLKVGFYEVDPQGYLININDYFAGILGYSKKELLETDRKLESLIDISNMSNPMQTIEVIEKKLLHKSWQGIVISRNKYKEPVHVILSQKVEKSDNNADRKIFGNVMKVEDKSLIIRSQGVEKGWLNYSWQCFFADAVDPVAIVDKSGTVLFANKAMESLFRRDIRNTSFHELFEEQKAQEIASIVDALINGGDIPSEIDDILIRNSDRIVRISIGKVRDLESAIYGIMVKVSDLTQQRELEEAFSHSQRMQTVGYLAGSIAHDFNNLLTTITGFCDLLFARHGQGDPSFTHIMQIKQSANKSANLVKRLLAFSRKQTLRPQVIDVHEMFVDSSGIIQRLVGSDINLEQKIDSDVWCIRVDQTQMEQVILNIVINARQAMQSHGLLSIRAYNKVFKDSDLVLSELSEYTMPKGDKKQEEGEYVAIEITDNGQGIPKDSLQKVFEPFFYHKALESWYRIRAFYGSWYS